MGYLDAKMRRLSVTGVSISDLTASPGEVAQLRGILPVSSKPCIARIPPLRRRRAYAWNASLRLSGETPPRAAGYKTVAMDLPPRLPARGIFYRRGISGFSVLR